jgi:AAA-like domain/CHAT domain
MDNNIYTRILLMSANSLSTSRLRLDEEMRQIKEGLKRSKQRDKYIINTAEAVRYRDIHRAILDYEPQIIHFSGHGAGEEGLIFEDEIGQIKLIDAAALAQLFQLFSEQIECVVLNACYSQYQAEGIAQHINYVVGMSQTIQDKAALEFAIGFYDALGAGKDYKFAYQLGCSLIKIAGIPQELIPQLVTKDNLNVLPSANADGVELADADDKFDTELNTDIYINRPPIEAKCYETIFHTGALIRIKAPQKMGKTLLLENLLSYATEQGYKTTKLDLRLADTSVLANLQSFLQWLCVDVSDSLDMEAKLDEHWQDIYGLNKNCTRYFQRYLLTNIENPLVFAIDNFELLFEYPDIFSEFCKLLRSWYETAKQGDKVGNIWKKLRLVVVHSTDAYPTLDTNYSPFNVGLAIDLPEFTPNQVEAVARCYYLNAQFGEQEVSQLMELVGGHPYLVQQALSNLKNQQTTLKQLLQLAPTEQGIFANHLRQLLWNLQHNPRLKDAYKKVVMAKFPVPVDSEVSFKLHSLGLVKLSGNDCIPSCNLYRQYFSVRLVET